jgi:heptosyltransferase II
VRDKRQGKLKSLFQSLRAVRAGHYDLVVNLHRFASSGILAGFSGGRHVCGFDKNPFSWRYHHRVPHRIGADAGGIHEVERNLNTIAHLSEGPPDPMRLYPSEADLAQVPQDVAYVCIAPTSVWFTKQWPAEKWTALIQALPAGLRVYLLGAPGDQGSCAGIASASGHPDVHNMCGKLNFLQSAALMAHARMNYVNDSAPLHFASAMQAPVTAVFCSTVPAFGFGPRSPQGRVVEQEGMLACRPCGLHGHRACPQGHFKCADIPIQQVLGAVST